MTDLLLRIYTDEAALDGDRRVFEVILAMAKDAGLIGATVLRGRSGFGRASRGRALGFIDQNYPLVIEIVDDEAALRGFVDRLRDLHGIGIATLERVETIIGGRNAA